MVQRSIEKGALPHTNEVTVNSADSSQTKLLGPAQTEAGLIDDTATGLPQIPGVNIRAGLTQISGKQTTFLRLLDQLIEIHGQDTVKIRKQLAENDFEGGVRLAHSLKGSAGMLGAEAISETASRIESSLKTGHSFEGIEKILIELDRHFNALRHALKETT